MPNIIDANGLQTATLTELIANFTSAMQGIYGNDINLESDTPDGEMMNIYLQTVVDLEDLLVQINNMFDPDNAVGDILDQRIAINGIQRQGGTYTVTPETIVVDRACTLYGLDQVGQTPYTVSDNAGNRWFLQTTIFLGGAGTNSLTFRAEFPGAQLTIPNTINVPVTIVLGVVSVNNPSTYSSLGITEESDAVVKIRRQKSVAGGSQGMYASLYAALGNIPGVTSVSIYQNTGGTTDGDGVPGHSIWVVVAGSGDAAAIAGAINRKLNGGAGMFGGQSYTIVEADGTSLVIHWDNVEPQSLFIRFTASSLDGVTPPNISAIRTGLVTSFVPGANQEVNVNALATAVQAIDPNTLVTNPGFSASAAGPYTNTLSPTSNKNQFIVTSANIIITPISIDPTSAIVTSGATKTFTGLGGFGAYVYSLAVNASGGSINAATGVYTAGPASSVVDVVRVTDANANTTTANVSVIAP